MWLHTYLEQSLVEQAFTATIGLKDFFLFAFASTVAFISRGKGICAWFGSFLLKAVLTLRQ